MTDARRTWVVAGTRRIIDAAATLERIMPSALSIGMTRVADVTRLDTIGIPVAIAVRPNSRSLSVAQGKGVTIEAAKASAAMECLELHHAEHVSLAVQIISRTELARRGATVVDVERLAKRQNSRFHSDLRIPWIVGSGARSGIPTLVPLEMVDMDCVRPRAYTTGCFYGGSNGLASGNCREEAIAHGLLELVERDAKSLWWHLGADRQAATQIDPASVDDPVAVDLIARFEAAGVGVAIWDMTSDLDIATFRVAAIDRNIHEYRRLSVTAGHGCHLDRGVALIRALTEAAQARLTAITGSRDDVTRASLEGGADALSRAGARRALELGGVQRRDFHEVPHAPNEFLEDDIDTTIERIEAAALPEPIVVDLVGVDDDDARIAVVKLVGPGLEPNPAEAVAAGHRLSTRLAARLATDLATDLAGVA